MSQTKVKDMTQGSVIKIIVMFALPILLKETILS